MQFLAKISIETDWDQPDGYIEETFFADSLEEAAEKVKKSVLYNKENLQYALNGEFDYNWQIIPEIVEWEEAAAHLSEHHDLERYGHKVANVTATITPIAPGAITVDLSKEWKAQNKILSDSENERKKRAQLEKLKRELGED